MLLSIKNLAVTYGNNSNPTIAGVNLDLAEGEIVSIVGESGSGKTTVIRALLLTVKIYYPFPQKIG